MARDYVGYLTPEYVRGTITDHIIYATQNAKESLSASFCHHCGNTNVDIEGCHIRCKKCKQVSEGCGD